MSQTNAKTSDPGIGDTQAAAQAAAAAAAAADRTGESGFLTPEEMLCGEHSIRAAIDTVGGTWAMMTLTGLRSGPMRYSELRRAVTGISDRMLSQTLKAFERDGLVERRVLRVIPSHVEYELTAVGDEVLCAVNDFLLTIMRLAPDVAAARVRYGD